jgi:hypothetical protein
MKSLHRDRPRSATQHGPSGTKGREPRAHRNLSSLNGLDLTRFRAAPTMARGQTGVHKLISLIHYSLLPRRPFVAVYAMKWWMQK